MCIGLLSLVIVLVMKLSIFKYYLDYYKNSMCKCIKEEDLLFENG